MVTSILFGGFVADATSGGAAATLGTAARAPAHS